MASKKDAPLATGRLGRFAKLASMSAKLSTDLVSRGVQRLRGEESASMLGAAAAEKLVSTLGDLKGLAMKLGQSLSMDPDLLTPEIRAVVAKLQNQAPPMPWSTVREVIAEQLGRPPEEAFASFEQAPLASASLGQVHRAVTHAGLPVAVKVQYPDIAKALLADLENVGAMVSVVATSTRMGHSKSYFTEMRDALLDELDYRNEAERAEVFRKAAAPITDLVVPRIERELSAERVLTLELLEGQTLKDFMHESGQRTAEERFAASRLLMRAIWGPFLVSGVIHADPHPGNFILMSNNRLGVLDYGAVKQLTPAWLGVNRRLFQTAIDGSPFDAMAESLACGFEFDDVDAARPFVESVLEIATRPAKSVDFDYGASRINRDMRALFLKNATKLGGIRPPKEAMQFFRSVGGSSMNLENLQARGDFRGMYLELQALVDAA